MKYIQVYLLFSIFIFSQCDVSQRTISSSGNERNLIPGSTTKMEAGKCYAKSLMPDQYTELKEEYIVFTGDAEEEGVETEEVSVVISPATTKWIKKKADRNCLSKDPDDCLVWCLIEVPEETLKYTTLIDTTSSENFEVRTKIEKVLAKKGGYTEFREVICDPQVDAKFIQQLQMKLTEEGYEPGDAPKVNSKLKSALTQFQRENDLPVGNLDVETLSALGVNF